MHTYILHCVLPKPVLQIITCKHGPCTRTPFHAKQKCLVARRWKTSLFGWLCLHAKQSHQYTCEVTRNSLVVLGILEDCHATFVRRDPVGQLAELAPLAAQSLASDSSVSALGSHWACSVARLRGISLREGDRSNLVAARVGL